MNKPTDNPFAAFDFSRMFGDLKMPGFDPSAMAATQQKNLDAIAAANKRALEGYQTLIKRQAEIFQETMQEFAKVMQQSAMSGTAQGGLTKQSELLHQSVEKCLANIRELTEIASRTNTEAFETINRRLSENLEELKKGFEKAKQ